MASDTFAGADGSPGANWTQNDSTFLTHVVSHVLMGGDASGYSGSWYSGASFAADHSSEITIVTSINYPGPATRMSGVDSARSFYVAFAHGSFQYAVSGSFFFGSSFTAASVGDQLKLVSVGGLHTPYINNVAQTPTSEGTLTTGLPGIEFYGNVGGASNWVGLDLDVLMGQIVL